MGSLFGAANLMLLFFFLYMSAAVDTATYSAATSWPLHVSISAAAWAVAFFTGARIATGTFYLLTSTYVATLMFFHFGQILPVALGIAEPAAVSLLLQGGAHTERAAWLALLALSCLGVGFFLGRPSDSGWVK